VYPFAVLMLRMIVQVLERKIVHLRIQLGEVVSRFANYFIEQI
jgi:hypothetical protein